jgi:ferredoxin-NADP reductase
MKIYLSQILGTLVTFEGSHEDAPRVRTFSFKAGKGVHWEPGQYYVYFLPGAILDRRSPVRPFTVASAPSESRLEITTRIPDQPSRFKRELLKLKPGAKVYTAGPYGFFTLKSGPSIFVAGGIGVTPFRSMLIEQAAAGKVSDITLLYSNRPGPVAFKAEFDKLAATYPNFKVHYISDPERLSAATVKKYAPNFESATVYLSGPKPLVKDLASSLKTELGINSSKIVQDSFKGYPWPLH